MPLNCYWDTTAALSRGVSFSLLRLGISKSSSFFWPTEDDLPIWRWTDWLRTLAMSARSLLRSTHISMWLKMEKTAVSQEMDMLGPILEFSLPRITTHFFLARILKLKFFLRIHLYFLSVIICIFSSKSLSSISIMHYESSSGLSEMTINLWFTVIYEVLEPHTWPQLTIATTACGRHSRYPKLIRSGG